MVKSRINREELIGKVLAAVRGEPGCEHVIEVGISEVSVSAGATCWRVTVIDAGDVKPAVAYRAARRVEERLNQRYQLDHSRK